MTTASAFLAIRQPPDAAPPEAIRFRDRLVVVLAFTTGAVNAASFLRLGGVFSSVITGNLALLGVAAGRPDAGLAVNAGLAIGGYGIGVLAGAAVARTPAEHQPVWPPRCTVALAAELVLLTGFSVGWVVTSGRPAGAGRLALLAVAAAGMGVQSTAVRRLGPMSATYLTSTLTGLLEALSMRRRPPGWRRSCGVLAFLFAGAGCGTLAVTEAAAALPAAIMVPLAVVVACCLPAAGRRRSATTGRP